MFNWITNRMSCYDVNDIQSLNQMTHDVSKDKSSKIIHTCIYVRHQESDLFTIPVGMGQGYTCFKLLIDHIFEIKEFQPWCCKYYLLQSINYHCHKIQFLHAKQKVKCKGHNSAESSSINSKFINSVLLGMEAINYLLNIF